MAWETHKHPLFHPITITVLEADPIEVAAVTLSMPNGKALRSIETMLKSGDLADEEDIGVAETLDFIGILSDLPEGGTDELHPADIGALSEAMAPFLEQALGALGMTSEKQPDGGDKTQT